MFICETCVEKYEGPAIEIAKVVGTRAKGICESCSKVALCFDIPARSNWQLKKGTK